MAARFLRRLDLSEEQRTALRAAREETQRVREALREQVRSLLEAARSGERTPESRKAVREQVKAAVQAAAEQVAPQAQRLVSTLTVEQRAEIQKAADARGRTVDEARLLKIFERVLLAPAPRHRAR